MPDPDAGQRGCDKALPVPARRMTSDTPERVIHETAVGQTHAVAAYRNFSILGYDPQTRARWRRGRCPPSAWATACSGRGQRRPGRRRSSTCAMAAGPRRKACSAGGRAQTVGGGPRPAPGGLGKQGRQLAVMNAARPRSSPARRLRPPGPAIAWARPGRRRATSRQAKWSCRTWSPRRATSGHSSSRLLAAPRLGRRGRRLTRHAVGGAAHR